VLSLTLLSMFASACGATSEESDTGGDVLRVQESIYLADPAIAAVWHGETAHEALSGNAASLVGGAEVNAPGRFGGAFRLNEQGDYVQVTDKAAFDVGAGDFTVSLWLKTADQGFRTILDNRQEDEIIRGYSLWLSEGALGIQLAAGEYTNYFTELQIADDRWHHIAISVTRDDPEGLRVFLDGFPAATYDPTPQQGDLNNANPLRLGAWSSYDYFTLAGSLDELKVWTKALSAAEVMAEASKLKEYSPGVVQTHYEEPYEACSNILAEGALAQWKAKPTADRAGILRDWVCTDAAASQHGALASTILTAFGVPQTLAQFKARNCKQKNRYYFSSAVTGEFLGPALPPTAAVKSAWQACMSDQTDGFYCEPGRFDKLATATLHWDTTFGPPSLNLSYPQMFNLKPWNPRPTVMSEGTVGIGMDFQSPIANLQVAATSPITEPFTSKFDSFCSMVFEEKPQNFVPCPNDRFHVRLDRVYIQQGGDLAGRGDNQWSICYGEGSAGAYTSCRTSNMTQGPTVDGDKQLDLQLGESFALDPLVPHGPGKCFQVKVTVWDNDLTGRKRKFYTRAEYVEAVTTYCWNEASKAWTSNVVLTHGGSTVEPGYFRGYDTYRFHTKAWWSVQQTDSCVQ
jgi:hypothetical protein